MLEMFFSNPFFLSISAQLSQEISSDQASPSLVDWTWIVGTIVITTGIITGVVAVINTLSPHKTIKEEALRESQYINDIKNSTASALDDIHQKISQIEQDIKSILGKFSDNKDEIRSENEKLKEQILQEIEKKKNKIVQETKELIDENKKIVEKLKIESKNEIIEELEKRQSEINNQLDLLLQQIVDLLDTRDK